MTPEPNPTPVSICTTEGVRARATAAAGSDADPRIGGGTDGAADGGVAAGPESSSSQRAPMKPARRASPQASATAVRRPLLASFEGGCEPGSGCEGPRSSRDRCIHPGISPGCGMPLGRSRRSRLVICFSWPDPDPRYADPSKGLVKVGRGVTLCALYPHSSSMKLDAPAAKLGC